ncbi:MAG: sulfite exporter TauE/SafE family protein [Alphaproteobacteria bacterium]|nr:sulfite exporter TauE/SafE family protein [Alphaproteobacteria bacterium]
MQIYLPIAEVSVDAFVILGLGGAVGFLSGLFGAGGAFLLTPLLIFLGVPPAVAVGSVANELIAASVSGAMAHWRRKNVDFRMGGVLLAGGLLGSGFGVWLFGILRKLGQIDLTISISYVLFLGTIGVFMLMESVRAIMRHLNKAPPARRGRHPNWVRALPLKLRFQKSRLYISALLPFGIGFFVGILSAIMGVGGGFVLIPAMIYLLGMPTAMVAGTSLFQIIFVSANVTFLQAVSHQTVDIVLAAILLIGAVVGAQYGTRFGARLPAAQLRGLLALMVLAVCGKLLFDLVVRPADLFSITVAPVDL